MTGGALTGGFGPTAEQIALGWIGEGMVHFVASDAHHSRIRPPRLRPAYQKVADQFSEEKARALFQENPQAAFEGQDLPHIPEVNEALPRRRRRFFFF